ncbi:TRAP transporter large permease subunit, partial [Pseudomonas sp. MOB-449]|nr:TRAP transporter large permease subunit [Pseudomonas sp. MOB-449]
VWWFVSRSENVEMPPKRSRQEVLRALLDGSWAMGLPVIIIVGLKSGIFTPTEAAVVAAVYSLFVSVVIYRELKLAVDH